ncbi:MULTISPECIES: hypothetical protein [Methanoculleus]|uniref:Lipoprotein n=2 Tax=Methanoculleus TaxID=45989 RepID=A3CWX2_METMJ|nr:MULTISPECIES: hypothetical protein [Methanoculleus]ABN57872.1 hypothetical protein Memar_1946 [Methanoculleus marisnigri JR1]UYU19258.1 hypothetical protein OH143_03990 [Methanoculleus submarinus]
MRCQLPIVLLALVVAQVFLCGCLSDEPQGLHTRFMHKLSIKTNTPIENVTFLVPVPTRDDLPAIGSEQISDAFYVDHLPEHYDCTIVPVDGQYYLQLTAPQMDPARPIHVDYYNYTSFGDKFRPEVVPQLIDTRYPFGNESLFSPKQNLTLIAGAPGIVETRGINPGCRYSYTIPVYAYYENGTRIEIYSDIWGENGWVEQFDAGMLNRYYDHYHLVITGDPQGWMPAGGVVTTGQGMYEEWQLNASPTSGAGE